MLVSHQMHLLTNPHPPLLTGVLPRAWRGQKSGGKNGPVYSLAPPVDIQKFLQSQPGLVRKNWAGFSQVVCGREMPELQIEVKGHPIRSQLPQTSGIWQGLPRWSAEILFPGSIMVGVCCGSVTFKGATPFVLGCDYLSGQWEFLVILLMKLLFSSS